ncbi:MAG: winged helix DNA-binding domain-containing protein [Myxococcota bacterium]
MSGVATLAPEAARAFMVGHHGLRQRVRAAGDAAVGEAARALLTERRCIQLDPLDVIGTNADLVALARIDGIARGDVYRHLMPGHAFEHFAKERCLLPATAFPYYRGQAAETSWWSHAERMRRLPDGVVEAVLAVVKKHGPLTVPDLEQHGEWGRVAPIDWSGWKGTAKAAAMALEVLWTRCEVVVAGRSGRGKLWDVPSRALGAWGRKKARASDEFARWALIERVEAAGLLARNAGPHWSMLSATRTSTLPEELVAEGVLEEVAVDGAKRTYLAPAGFRERTFPEDDGDMRVLGPLDSVLWDRKLVAHAFGFDYVWEVYKPAHTRRFGWYVCPIMHRGQLVARLEARTSEDALEVTGLWPEAAHKLDRRALKSALRRHATALGKGEVVLPR